MASISNILGGDLPSNSRTDINNNFTNLNNDKIETSVISTDSTLGGVSASDSKLATQKAVKDYADAVSSPTGKSWNEYAVSSNGTDSYAITVPGLTALVEGMTFKFKADVANTGACTLNVNGLGAKSIKKILSSDLDDNDIKAGSITEVFYDGSVMQSGITSIKGADVQIFTANGTWTKPGGAKVVDVIGIGEGGNGSNGTINQVGTAGGGGAKVKITFLSSALSSTETVTIGTGGSGVSTSFGTKLVAGNGGNGGAAGNSSVGGDGGSAGLTKVSANAISGQGTIGSANVAYSAEYGGGSGRGDSVGAGGSSLYGAGAGGSGANGNNTTGGDGGKNGSYAIGGGGAGVLNGNGTNGASRTGTGLCGDGGGGGAGAAQGGTAKNGGNGGLPGGGGGGGGAVPTSGTPGKAGTGARGELIVITYF